MGASLFTNGFTTCMPMALIREKIRKDERIVHLSGNPYQGISNGSRIDADDIRYLKKKEREDLLKKLKLKSFKSRKEIFEKGNIYGNIFLQNGYFSEKQRNILSEILDEKGDYFMRAPKYQWKVFEVLPLGVYHFNVKWKKMEDVRTKDYFLVSEGKILKKGKLAELKKYAIDKKLSSAEIRTNSEGQDVVFYLEKKGVLTDFDKMPKTKYQFHEKMSFFYAGLWCAE